jgi:glycosidase
MQWHDEVNAGFSEAEPWLPVNDNYPERNVDSQTQDPESLLNSIKQLIKIRKSEPALQQGDFKSLNDDPRHILAFERTWDRDRILILLNFSSRDLVFDLPEGEWQSLFSENHTLQGSLALTSYQVELLKCKG